MEALHFLEGQTDAKGRRLEVVKLPCPPPLHITEEESSGVAHVEGSKPRKVRGHPIDVAGEVSLGSFPAA